jgi:Tfp pilus assembly protein PilF
MFVSTDGRTFKEPDDTWNVTAWLDPKTYFAGSPQSLAGDLIREGATGVAAHVAEPFLDSVVRPQILFPAYLNGFNLAESFYLAMPFLSWQTVIVGDPLCRPFTGAQLSTEAVSPELDPITELPKFFSGRRLDALATFGVRPEIARLMLKANARLLHDDLDGAGKALEEVTVIEPGLNAAHFVLAGIYEQTDQYDKAIARYRRILSTVPGDVRSLNNLAYALATKKNEITEAMSLVKKAHELASTDQVVIDLGYALIARKGTPAASLPFGVPAYNLNAVRAQIADTLGWIYHLTGNDAEAIKFLTLARQGDPTHPLIHLHVAVVEAAHGRLEQAQTALQTALELDPGLEDTDDAKKVQSQLSEK